MIGSGLLSRGQAGDERGLIEDDQNEPQDEPIVAQKPTNSKKILLSYVLSKWTEFRQISYVLLIEYCHPNFNLAKAGKGSTYFSYRNEGEYEPMDQPQDE